LEKLLAIMQELRDPKTGCPWDIEQTFDSISNCAVEEAYEVVESIEDQDFQQLKNELGDLLFQVVFHSEMANELNLFNFQDVVDSISEKLTARHPHVFGEDPVNDAKTQVNLWEHHKIKEMKLAASEVKILDGIGTNQPALNRALKLSKRAASVGFDWQSEQEVLTKITEELDELKVAVENQDSESIKEEIGDLLFSVVNIARYSQLDPENALRQSNRKFETRFGKMEEKLLATDQKMENLSFTEMDRLWEQVKSQE
jgi:MazG family protein